MGDTPTNGNWHAGKLDRIAPTRRLLYTQGARRMVGQKDEGQALMQIARPEVTVRRSTLTDVAKAIASADPPEQ